MTSPISDMMPTMLSAAASSPTSTSSGAGSADIGGINGNTFLQLLVSQLTHQDPMNPTDSTTYITEEAEFSMVQSMNQLAKQNASILQSQQMQEATGFIGKNVAYVGATGATGTGIVASASPGSDGAVVRVGGMQVPLSSITSVSAPTA
jgi:flagellar basal-body rod modification protein FlgD